MRFYGQNSGVELEGIAFCTYGIELPGCYLNTMEANVHDHGNVVSKDSII